MAHPAFFYRAGDESDVRVRPTLFGDVKAFQASALNHLGLPLRVDGDVGPQTEWALDFETLSARRRATVRSAQLHLGLVEYPPGSNDDPAGIIDKWLKNSRAREGDPWCAAFASACVGARIANAQMLGRHFPITRSPFAGDLMWYPTSGVYGHCGLVIGVSATEVMTIEGNLDHAVRCVRRPRAGLRFSQTAPDAEGVCPGVVPSVPLVGVARTR